MASPARPYFHWFDARLLPNALYILVLPSIAPSSPQSPYQYQIFHAYSTPRKGMLFSYTACGSDGRPFGWKQTIDHSFNRPPIIVSVRLAEVSESDWREIADTIFLACSVARSQGRSVREWLEICIDGLTEGKSRLVKGDRNAICAEVDHLARGTPAARFGPECGRFVDAQSCRIVSLGTRWE